MYILRCNLNLTIKTFEINPAQYSPGANWSSMSSSLGIGNLVWLYSCSVHSNRYAALRTIFPLLQWEMNCIRLLSELHLPVRWYVRWILHPAPNQSYDCQAFQNITLPVEHNVRFFTVSKYQGNRLRLTMTWLFYFSHTFYLFCTDT